MSGRPLFFYSSWPLEYHNREATRKAEFFASRGYDVVYVAGIGFRNPGLTNLRKLADRAGRKLRRAPSARGDAAGLRTAALAVTPPRELRAVRRLNAVWTVRQLGRAVSPWSEAVA